MWAVMSGQFLRVTALGGEWCMWYYFMNLLNGDMSHS